MKDLTKIKTPFGLLKPKVRKALRAHGGPYQRWCVDGWRDWTFGNDGWSDDFVIRVKPADLITLTTVFGSTLPHPIFAAVKEWQEARLHWQAGEDYGDLWAAANALAEIKVPS